MGDESPETILGRIDERTKQMDLRFTQTVEHVEKRFDETTAHLENQIRQEREDRKAEAAALRKELKRLPAIIATAVSAAFAGMAQALGMGGQS